MGAGRVAVRFGGWGADMGCVREGMGLGLGLGFCEGVATVEAPGIGALRRAGLVDLAAPVDGPSSMSGVSTSISSLDRVVHAGSEYSPSSGWLRLVRRGALAELAIGTGVESLPCSSSPTPLMWTLPPLGVTQ